MTDRELERQDRARKRREREHAATRAGVARAFREALAYLERESDKYTRSDAVHMLFGWLTHYCDDDLKKEVEDWLNARPAPGPVCNPTDGGGS